jgi:cbb3-type cytochrome oxidase subunit 3
MINQIAFTIMLAVVALAAIYIVWWTNKQERNEERKQEGR